MQTLPDEFKLASIQSAALHDGDVLVLMTDGNVNDEMATRLIGYMDRVFPGHKCIVLCDGLKLGIINREDPDADEHHVNEAAAVNDDERMTWQQALECTASLHRGTVTRWFAAIERKISNAFEGHKLDVVAAFIRLDTAAQIIKPSIPNWRHVLRQSP